MGTNRSRRVSSARILVLGAALIAASACVNGPDGHARPGAAEPDQPPLAAYDCGEDGTLTVENHGNAVRVIDAGGTILDLPASPPDQENRYSADLYALVLEGQDALFMKSGESPIACRR